MNNKGYQFKPIKKIAFKNFITVFLFLILSFLNSCSPYLREPGQTIRTPQLTEKEFFTADGEILALKTWRSEDNPPKAIIIALHGFNDYSNFFKAPGTFFAKQGILSYAYDQRGFGASKYPGSWSGAKAMTNDLRTFIGLVKDRHPLIPLYLLGESMGGALIIVAATEAPTLNVNGVILSAPAVWGRITMPWYQRIALQIGVHIMPSVKITGEKLNLKPSDNIKMLQALGRDPLIIQKTRVDAVFGLVNLMDKALKRTPHFTETALILYGEKDDIIPSESIQLMLSRLNHTKKRYRLALYKNGYHMLLRDLKARIPWNDIVYWIQNNDQPLKSGSDLKAYKRLSIQNEVK